jgi:hypothetical protein
MVNYTAEDRPHHTKRRQLASNTPKNKIAFNTDGSKTDGHTTCAMILANLTVKTRLPDETSIFSAELFAMLVAMERLTDDLLLTDSLSSL